MKTSRVIPIAVASAMLATALIAQSAPTTPAKATAPSAVPHNPKVPQQGDPNTHFVRINSTEFAFDNSSSTFDTRNWNPTGSYSMVRYLTGSYPHVYGWAHIPGGTKLTYVELDYCDTNATNHVTLDVYSCDYHAECTAPPLSTLTSGGDGCFDSSDDTLAYTMNNFDNAVLLDVTLSALDGTNGLAGVIVGWQYQVSPAPGTPTFNDVPTDNPFFQYIEALAASGITGGCGSGNFCPDQPVLRKQMATFLAKALGLSWGGY